MKFPEQIMDSKLRCLFELPGAAVGSSGGEEVSLPNTEATPKSDDLKSSVGDKSPVKVSKGKFHLDLFNQKLFSVCFPQFFFIILL